MTATHADQLIAGYLARLADAAKALPQGPRTELLDDMRRHIAEARGRESGEENDATILNILDRLGEPSVVVAETRERLGLQAVQPYRPGILEIGALILLVLFWPIGVVLLWISPAWNLRDRLIGTLLPPGGFMGVLIFGLSVATVQGPSCGGTTQFGALNEMCSPTAEQTAFAAIVGILLLILPLITTAYLAIRLRWGRPAMMRFA